MADDNAGQSSEDVSLKDTFEHGMKLFEKVENTNEPSNSDAVQLTIKSAISTFEKATNMVSYSGMFSTNESLEELPTETLQYLLLPALLGTLSLKLCRQPRKEVIDLAEIYFKDFLQRCKDYGVTDVEIPQSSSETQTVAQTSQTEQAKIANMVHSREAKIKRYKELKVLKEKLQTLSQAMASNADDETKREYFTTLLLNYVNLALDELHSIEQEIPILQYMEQHAGEAKPKAARPPPLRPVIITRDAVQKAVYGAGYPSLPTMTVEEFYDQRVREGTFPGGCNIPHQTIQNTEENDDDEGQVRKEQLEENDDEDELARKRAMDEYKDDHRRGWGNRHNRS